GNRLGKGGEYLALLRPCHDGLKVLPRSMVEVYRRLPTGEWEKIIQLNAAYGPTQLRGQP
ncbi:MAG TPA: hypothetical protein PKA06_07340, partial [Gemmatales bacterium]|nr:hypothetical protein [Gemmatales bacterium]